MMAQFYTLQVRHGVSWCSCAYTCIWLIFYQIYLEENLAQPADCSVCNDVWRFQYQTDRGFIQSEMTDALSSLAFPKTYQIKLIWNWLF